MYKVKDYIMYKRDVCIIDEIKKNSFNNKDYYVLKPIDDQSLTIEIPISNKNGYLRDLITKKELVKIIKSIPDIDMIDCTDRTCEYEYKNLLYSNLHENLIKIIKTTYCKNREKIDNNKKISDRDNKYFMLAEKCLYNEFSIVLNLSYDETKKYVINEVMDLIK